MKHLGLFRRIIRNPGYYFWAVRTMLLSTSFCMWCYHRVYVRLLVRRIARKRQVNVVFLAMNPAMWRYGEVYRRLKADSRFNPIVLTAMNSGLTEDERVKQQELMVNYFIEMGISVLRGYIGNNEWLDLNSLNPDIVFHTQPYPSIVDDSFSFRRHWNALHCYTSYFFPADRIDWTWNNLLQNYCWRQYVPAEFQIQLCRECAKAKGWNAVAAGYFLEEEYAQMVSRHDITDGVWKVDKRKRVIWAPHHSILPDEMYKVSSFLEICDLMVKIRDDYADRVIFAFKPHPVLKMKLYSIWGEEKTDAYYAKWAKSPNSFEAEGQYNALFAGSDAMIHCSGSFLIEYLYTGKPVQYVYAKSRNPPCIGEVYDQALRAHYQAHSEHDIRVFLDKVVIEGIDPKMKARSLVAQACLKSLNGKFFSENLYDDIVKSLWS